MKIPETSANVGAYYGNNEENGQWQPNGMIIDSGVGGGVVGSGDAGLRAPYPAHAPRPHLPGNMYAMRRGRHPVHMPRPHIPAGYVMAGPYYPPGAYPPPGAPPGAPDDFADYMWMENEEEFDKQVMQQLEEEALMEQCIEAMLEDEQREQRQRPAHNGHHHYPTTSNGGPSLSIEETLSRSTLNPLAAEFVPTRGAPPGTPPRAVTEDKQQLSQPPAEAAPAPEPERAPEESPTRGEGPTPEVVEDSPQETDAPAPQPEHPEVSAAGLRDASPRPGDRRDSRDRNVAKEQRRQTTVKVETRNSKPQVAKSETKVQPRRREVRSAKSEARVEEREGEAALAATEVVKPLPQPTPVEEPAPSGPKPINYAAAARANKPKKPSTPPVHEKTPPPVKVSEKKALKAEKPVQRKSSTK